MTVELLYYFSVDDLFSYVVKLFPSPVQMKFHQLKHIHPPPTGMS